MTVRYTPRAEADLDRIYEYLKRRSPYTAIAVLKAVREQVGYLSDHPAKAAETEMPGIRSLTIRRYPLKIYHRIIGGEIIILHVRDARRVPWKGGE